MHGISEIDLILSLLALLLFIVVGRGAGDVARRLGQPEILGQLLGGFLLGPSVFGAVLPGPYHMVFQNAIVGGAISVFSWLGAILLLLLAGTDVNLAVLRQQIGPSALAAAGAIIPSFIAGFVFGRLVFGSNGILLAIVLTVTATTAAAAILTPRGVLERRYAQVILASGVTSEILVWLLVSVASSTIRHSPLLSLLVSGGATLVFFLIAIVIARPLVNWSMRRMADLAPLPYGVLSLVLAYTLLGAVITQALGLHVLLGAFVVGLVLGQAPRFDIPIHRHIQASTTALFAPIFFVAAGTRVNLFEIHDLSAIATIVGLLVVASVAKIGFAALGARLGGVPFWQAILVGVGLNLKGGTDVIVAIIGVELHLLSRAAFTMYAVVAMLTVALSPPLIAWLAKRTPPTPREQARLERQAAARHAYVAHLQRVLLPLVPQLLPVVAAGVARAAAIGRQRVGEQVDLIEVVPGTSPAGTELQTRVGAILSGVGAEGTVHVLEREVEETSVVDAVMSTAREGDLISIGARPPHSGPVFSLGRLQDVVLRNGKVDVMATVTSRPYFDCTALHRILVPVNGLEYSLAAGDIAGLLGAGCDAEVVVFTVVQPGSTDLRPRTDAELQRTGRGIAEEATFRLSRFDVRMAQQVVVGDDVTAQTLRELSRQPYQLLVLGSKDRGRAGQLYLGGTVEKVLTQVSIPAVLFVAHRTTVTASVE